MNTAGADQQQQQQQQQQHQQHQQEQQQQHIIPFSANYPSFGGKKILNPSVSDVELVWNFIKVGFYFGSLLLCLSPVVTDACAPPASQEELEDELDDLLDLSASADDFEEDGNAAKSKDTKKVTKQQQEGSKHHQQSRWANFRQGLSKTARTVKTKTTHAVRVALLMSFISICAYTTWTFILAFLAEDRSRFVEFSQWIAKSDWMVSSYELVSLRPEQWFWSSQLLFFVVPMTLYIVIEHARSLRFYYDDCGDAQDGVKISKAAAGSTTTTSTVECESAFRPLWNLWLGCGVAISVSFPLAMSSIVISSWNRFTVIAEKTDKITSSNTNETNNSNISQYTHVVPRLRALRHAVPLNMCVILLPLIIAFACVVMIPVADSSTFGIVLGGLHFFIVLPPAVAQFFPQFVSFCPQSLTRLEKHQNTRANALLDWQRRTSQSMWIPISFIGFAAATLALHLVNFFHVLGSTSANHQLFSTLVKGFCYNNCQCSISLDVVQCSIAVMIFIWFLPHLTAREMLVLSCSTPILSLGVTFSVAIALNELRVIQARMITASSSSSSPNGEAADELFDLVFPSSSNIFVDDVERQITLVGHRSITTTTAVISREKSISSSSTSTPRSRQQQFVVGSPELNSSSSFNLYDRSSPRGSRAAAEGTVDRILSTNPRLTESTSFNIDDRATNGSVSSSSFQLAKNNNKNQREQQQHKQLRRQKTYLDNDDDDDDDEDEMFNKEARRVLSPEEWKKKRNLTRRKQELIRPVVGVVDTNASKQGNKKKKTGSIIVDEEDTDPAFASASSSGSTATAEYDGDDQTDEEDDDEDLASEADSTSPRHPTNDEDVDSRSSGMSGVYSENDD